LNQYFNIYLSLFSRFFPHHCFLPPAAKTLNVASKSFDIEVTWLRVCSREFAASVRLSCARSSKAVIRSEIRSIAQMILLR
jgi:hypothetical protein